MPRIGFPSAVTPAASSSASPASTASSRPRRSPASRSSSRSPSARPSAAGAAYISDLIGCTVFDRGQPLGTVAGVHFPTTPDGARRLDAAAPLLVLTSPSGDEVLVPFARAFLVALDPAAKSIRMALPEGLANLNLQPNRAAPEK